VKPSNEGKHAGANTRRMTPTLQNLQPMVDAGRAVSHYRHMEASQTEFFGFPVIEERTKVKSQLRQYLDAIAVHGPLVPAPMAAAALDLSKQRIYQLMNTGQLATVNVDGNRWVPVAVLELFWTEERKSGRPCKLPKLSKLVKAGF
jgi:hypothetical protein